MTVCFRNTEEDHIGRYDGWNDPSGHLMECQTLWASRPKDEWVHAFIHTLDEMPRSWYVLAKMRKEIATWEEMTSCFAHTFSFTDANPDVNNALQIIRDVVLKIVPVAYPTDLNAHFHMRSMMECYNIFGKPEDDDELRNINIIYIEGSRDVATPDVLNDPMSQP